jgi:hypothetical protein
MSIMTGRDTGRPQRYMLQCDSEHAIFRGVALDRRRISPASRRGPSITVRPAIGRYATAIALLRVGAPEHEMVGVDRASTEGA